MPQDALLVSNVLRLGQLRRPKNVNSEWEHGQLDEAARNILLPFTRRRVECWVEPPERNWDVPTHNQVGPSVFPTAFLHSLGLCGQISLIPRLLLGLFTKENAASCPEAGCLSWRVGSTRLLCTPPQS